MRSAIAAFVFPLLSLCVASGARATTFSTDASDLWYNPNESGWGVNVIQQEEILFMTFFVYTGSAAPIWYVAPSTAFVASQNASLVYSGPLYQTDGPWFGGVFNPADLGSRQVGTATFTLDSVGTATLAYSVDGVNVTKQVQRQTWRTNDISGSYLGATVGTYSGCGASSGYAEDPASVTITQSASGATLVATGTAVTCTYAGPYVQSGRMGSIGGSFACSNGAAGTFQAFEIEAGISGLTGRIDSDLGGGCTWSGRFGGVRRGP